MNIELAILIILYYTILLYTILLYILYSIILFSIKYTIYHTLLAVSEGNGKKR